MAGRACDQLMLTSQICQFLESGQSRVYSRRRVRRLHCVRCDDLECMSFHVCVCARDRRANRRPINFGKYLCLAILTNNEEYHFWRSITCLGKKYTCVVL